MKFVLALPTLALLPSLIGGCKAPASPDAAGARVARDLRGGDGAAAPATRPATPRHAPDAEERLAALHHRQWVAGDIAGARRGLLRLLEDAAAAGEVRARAALRLAEISDLMGDRRQALAYAERVRQLVGSQSQLAMAADDRRDRILSITPLADVRGPAPGRVRFQDEPAAVVAAFRRAELRLRAYYRVVVRPRLETIETVRAAKRRALRRAVVAYEAVLRLGGAAARAAARFRIAAMYHHMAEALGFERPPELLPAVARQLQRRLRAESTAFLKKALAGYRSVARVPDRKSTRRWRQLAAREARALAPVLERSAGR